MKYNLIFIIGCPRTGTTLLRNLLNNMFPGVYIFNETHIFDRLYRNRSKYNKLGYTIATEKIKNDIYELFKYHQSEDFILFNKRPIIEKYHTGDLFKDFFLNTLVTYSPKDTNIYGDSDPKNSFYTQEITSLFGQDVIFIVMKRDPRGYLSSAKNSWRTRSGTKKQIKYSYRHYNSILSSLNFLRYYSSIKVRNKIEIKYEDLVNNTREILYDVGKVIGVEPILSPKNISDNSSFRDDKQTNEFGVFANSAYRWKTELSEEEKYFCTKICRKFIMENRYDFPQASPNYLKLFAILFQSVTTFVYTIFMKITNSKLDF